jgi:O-antigen/teichoic acid export membrane protein
VRADVLRRGGAAAHVAGSQVALAASNYVVLAIAARHLEPAGFAAVSAYYLLINTVGRGLFAAVELETTRAVAAGSHGRGAALRHTGLLLVGALVLLGLAAPLLTGVLPGAATMALLAVGAATMAASYLVRGPLAGLQRYGRYAATFWIEAGVGLAAAVVLAVVDEQATTAWIAVLALAPGVAPLLLGGRGMASRGGAAPVGPVLWSAALLLAGQGVWNLAPVLVTARLADAPTLAAGFTTAAVIVRAPVLLFPTIQAMLLPGLAAGAARPPGEPGSQQGDPAAVHLHPRPPRVLVGGIAAAGLVWVVVAAFAVPWVAALVFATTAPPPTWVVAVLALSTVLGALAQVVQAQLVAVRRTHAAALAWLVGLGVLLVVGLVARPPVDAAAFGQLAAALVVLCALVVLGALVPARRTA